MKTIVITEFGPPEVMKYTDIQKPDISPSF
ncbi:hypothetical protein AT864_02140 [Anoxybacillus sp. P3H1B]|nr:hypothetical protein AT864_02140 [Anoxybacillus sp. P3H1B]